MQIRLTAIILVLGMCSGAAAARIDYQDLRPNRWVEISSDKSFPRQQHSGIAYDSLRGRVLAFGSDTHGMNTDNSVREFDPETGRGKNLHRKLQRVISRVYRWQFENCFRVRNGRAARP